MDIFLWISSSHPRSCYTSTKDITFQHSIQDTLNIDTYGYKMDNDWIPPSSEENNDFPGLTYDVLQEAARLCDVLFHGIMSTYKHESREQEGVRAELQGNRRSASRRRRRQRRGSRQPAGEASAVVMPAFEMRAVPIQAIGDEREVVRGELQGNREHGSRPRCRGRADSKCQRSRQQNDEVPAVVMPSFAMRALPMRAVDTEFHVTTATWLSTRITHNQFPALLPYVEHRLKADAEFFEVPWSYTSRECRNFHDVWRIMML